MHRVASQLFTNYKYQHAQAAADAMLIFVALTQLDSGIRWPVLGDQIWFMALLELSHRAVCAGSSCVFFPFHY